MSPKNYENKIYIVFLFEYDHHEMSFSISKTNVTFIYWFSLSGFTFNIPYNLSNNSSLLIHVGEKAH